MIKYILIHLVTILPIALVKYSLTLLGYVAVAAALPFARIGSLNSIIMDKGGRLLWAERHLPKWAWIWDNDRDGTLGDKRGWWRYERCDGRPGTCWNQYRWTALRNPVNNLQRIWPFYLNGLNLEKTYIGDYRVDDDPDMGGWHFVQSGWRTGFYLIYEYGFMDKCLEIRTGWKLRPEPQKDKAVGMTVLIHPWRRL